MITHGWMSESLEGDKIRCLACSHKCVLNTGEKGICGVRENRNGELKLLVYGRVVSTNIDPVEKKPLYHFLPGSKIYSLGTVGCNFRCEFCQNSDISAFHREKGNTNIEKTGFFLPPEKIIEDCLEKRIPSIAFTYNEPTIFFEFAYETARLAKEAGLFTVFVSNGYETHEALSKLIPFLDAINVDLKSFRQEFYRKLCGASLEPILENLKTLYKSGVHLEITTLLIPGWNDQEDELVEIARFISSISRDIPWHVSRFFPRYKMEGTPATDPDQIRRAVRIGKKMGLNYVYPGNLTETGKLQTICPGCGTVLVDRQNKTRTIILEGKCPDCQTRIYGFFN